MQFVSLQCSQITGTHPGCRNLYIHRNEEMIVPTNSSMRHFLLKYLMSALFSWTLLVALSGNKGSSSLGRVGIIVQRRHPMSSWAELYPLWSGVDLYDSKAKSLPYCRQKVQNLALFLSRFFKVCTAHSACPLLRGCFGLLVTCFNP